MLRRVLLGGLLLLVAGCGSTYYKIADPSAANKVYYTTGYQDLGYGQGVRFTDIKSGSQVTLPASDIKKINKEDLPPDVASAVK
jgi:hypothetical protein